MATNDCWIEVWESKNYSGRSRRFDGPIQIAKLANYQWAGGGDIHDDIDSIVVGPAAWFIGYEDENFTDTQITLGPNSRVADLTRFNMQDQIDSFKIFDNVPPEWND